jgi:hypothetical protein
MLRALQLKSRRRSHALKGSHSMGDGRILLKPRRDDSLISAGSISLDSNFKDVFRLITYLKETVLRDRFRKCLRKLTDLCLNKGHGWFLNFSEAPLIFG